MRNFCAAVVAAALLTSSAFAADAPLAAGKPAGLRKAQGEGDNTLLFALGVGAVIAGVVLVASSGGDDNAGSGGAVVPTTSSK